LKYSPFAVQTMLIGGMTGWPSSVWSSYSTRTAPWRSHVAAKIGTPEAAQPGSPKVKRVAPRGGCGTACRSARSTWSCSRVDAAHAVLSSSTRWMYPTPSAIAATAASPAAQLRQRVRPRNTSVPATIATAYTATTMPADATALTRLPRPIVPGE